MDSIGIHRQFPDDALPPEGYYSSREELRSAINAWAAPRGYAFVIKRSSKTANGRTHVIFNCDRGAGRIPSLSDRRQGCRQIRLTIRYINQINQFKSDMKFRQINQFKHKHLYI
jgi:hypothetical protein